MSAASSSSHQSQSHLHSNDGSEEMEDNGVDEGMETDENEEENIRRKQRSIAWDYFQRFDNDLLKAKCNLCSTVLKLPSATTTTMFNHLRNKHKNEWSECERKRMREETRNIQRRARRTLTMTVARKQEIDEAIMEFIAQDLQSFSAANGKGFKKLLTKLEPEYEIPHRTTFSEKIAPEVYRKTKTKLKEKLADDVNAGLLSMSFTTDCWTSQAGHSYLSLTIHYINQSFEVKNVMLGVKQLEDRHTAQNLQEILTVMLKDRGLSDIPGALTIGVTDNARNITAAMRRAGWTNVNCFAHVLQLVLKDARKDSVGVNELLTKCRRVATHFHHSDPARRDLVAAQQDADSSSTLYLIQMVDTRWNSKYSMLKRMIELKRPLSQVLANSSRIDNFTGKEWRNVEEIVQVLEPLYEATVLACAKQYPTLSMVIPLVHTLKDVLANMSFERPRTQSPGHDLSKHLIEGFDTRFSDLAKDTLYLKSTFIDPRYKTFFFNEEEKKKIADELINEISVIQKRSLENQETTTSSVTGNNSPNCNGRRHLLDFLDEVRDPQPSDQVNDELKKEIEREILAYTQMRRILQKQDPIQWWNAEAPKYPHLSLIARKYLGIPATSAESERLFSTAGDIVTQKRTSLSPENVELLLFLSKNLV